MKPVKFKISEKKDGFKVIMNGIKYPRGRGKIYLRDLHGIPLHPTKEKALEHATAQYFSENKERDNIIRDIEVGFGFNWTGKFTGTITRSNIK